MKKLLLILCSILATSAGAESSTLTDECVQSVRDLYRFYYYEIHPNPKKEACKNSENLGKSEALEMQIIIGELKNNCPAELVAKINQSLAKETQES